MIFLLFTTASAYEPELGAHATIGLGLPELDAPLVVGGGAALGLPLVGKLHAELAGDFGLTTGGGRWGGATFGARLFMWNPNRPVLSVFAGGGVASETTTSPWIHGGVALDLDADALVRPRVQVGYGFSLNETSRLLVNVGAIFGRKAPLPLPPQPPPPPSLPPPEPERVRAVEPGMVWVPNPVCEWIPTEEANAEIERLGLDPSSLSVISTRLLRFPDAPLNPVIIPGEDRSARPGRIVVSTSDYDHVKIADQEVIVDGGAAVGVAGEGMAWVEVIGGGRKLRMPVGVARDNAIWLPIDPPQNTFVSFAVGQTSIAGPALGTIEELAELRGDWSYHIQGSFSAGGNLASNQALARIRAESVYQALLLAGVPAGALRIIEIQPPDASLPPDQQRSAIILPVETP